MKNYRLATHGDDYEQQYWSLFIQNKFQSYEDFWIKNIVPLTNRPHDIHFKEDKDLPNGKTANDICIAQLHYSILRHLAHAFDIWQKGNINIDELTDGMNRLFGALDVSFELLERFKNPSQYDPWHERKKENVLGGKEARENWNEVYPKNIKLIRYYRNHLVHGRMTPGIVGRVFYLPKIGMEDKYYDWRTITSINETKGNIGDFIPAHEILERAWNDVINYLNNQWKQYLLKDDITTHSNPLNFESSSPRPTASGVINFSGPQYSASQYEQR